MTYTLPIPLPAPVTTVTRPLKLRGSPEDMVRAEVCEMGGMMIALSLGARTLPGSRRDRGSIAAKRLLWRDVLSQYWMRERS
jgi:hypothetical protein